MAGFVVGAQEMAECLASGVGFTVDAVTGCWLWDHPAPSGYGPFLAAWDAVHPGPLPPGVAPEHFCTGGPRGCVRPDHLTIGVIHRRRGPGLPAGERAAFARRLRDEREARGASHQEIARLLGVSAPTLRSWEDMLSAPTVDQVAAMAREFGWDAHPRKWVVVAAVERVVIATSAGAAAGQVRAALNVPGHADKVVIGRVTAAG